MDSGNNSMSRTVVVEDEVVLYEGQSNIDRSELEIGNRGDDEWEEAEPSDDPLEIASDDDMLIAMDEMYRPPDLYN
jgi:hypothetical protein